MSTELLSLSPAEVAGAVRHALCAAFGFGKEEEESIRILYKERDLDEGSAATFLRALRPGGIPCAVRVLFRLLGGKGGFGALLRRSGKAGKKTSNFDAQRDLSGRRIRHSKAVERIKEWMELKKADDDLVKLITGEGPELPKAPDPNSTLDPEYVRKLKRAGANKIDIVSAGLQRRLEEDSVSTMEPSKRPRLSVDDSCASEVAASQSSGGMGLMSALGALGSPSSPASGDSDDDVLKTKTAGSASSSSLGPAAGAFAAAAARAVEEAEEDQDEASGDEDVSDGDEDERATSTPVHDVEHVPEMWRALGCVTQTEPTKRSRGCRGGKVVDESVHTGANTSDNVTIVRPEDLADYGNPEELVNSVDADDLKRSLQRFGMKCGGSARERAARLFMLKLTALEDLPQSVLAPKK
jgi:hypothetical protein